MSRLHTGHLCILQSSAMSLPSYSTMDVLNFGDRPSVLQADDYPLFLLGLELVWSSALSAQTLGPRVTKVTVTSESMHALPINSQSKLNF